MNTWLREYLQKPGRRSSQQEQARRQVFLAAVYTEADSLPTREVSDPLPLEANVDRMVVLEH